MTIETSVVAVILAGGEGRRLKILSHERAKPAVPFGGIYRIIDFTLSNLMHSGINKVGVLTQYRPSSLMDHLGVGESWDFFGRMRELKVLPPVQGFAPSDWYLGTANAVYQNMNYIRRHHPKLVLVLSGDHIYRMDYSQFIDAHLANNATVSVTTMRVPLEECSRFGILTTDADGRVTEFYEKPENPVSTLASLGIYCFNLETLIAYLEDDSRKRDSSHDFGKDIMPQLIARERFYAHEFTGYWRDVGTIQSYWEANMDILNPQSGLNLREWKVRTNLRYRWVEELHPSRYSFRCKVVNSIISKGCNIEGEVRNSILGPGVSVNRNSVIEDSIVMHDACIGRGSIVRYSIIDKDVVLGDKVKIGGAREQCKTDMPFGGITIIGKRNKLPNGYTVGKGCMIGPKYPLKKLPPKILPDAVSLEE